MINLLDNIMPPIIFLQILDMLNVIDSHIEYTRDMIRASEFEVFRTIEFRIPSCTPIQCIEILLAATGIRNTPDLFKILLHFLDFAYLKVCIHFHFLKYII